MERRAEELSRAIALEFERAAAEPIRWQTEQPARDNAERIYAAWLRVVERCRADLNEAPSHELMTAAFVQALHEAPGRCAAVFGSESKIRDSAEAVRAIELATGPGPRLDQALTLLEQAVRAVVPATSPSPEYVERFRLRLSTATHRRLHIAIEAVNARVRAEKQAEWAAKHEAEMASRRKDNPRVGPRVI